MLNLPSTDFDKAVKQFSDKPESYTDPKHPGFADLITGWGNEIWSGQAEYLAACIEHSLNHQHTILECGSGLSTVLVGIVAKQQGNVFYSLEHSPDWAKRTQVCLNKYSIDTVQLIVTPLKDYGEYYWYDTKVQELPENISLVLCDGPPGDTKGGRYGLLPCMQDKLSNDYIILLDDAERPEEHETALRWAESSGGLIKIKGDAKPYAEIRL